MMKPQDQNLDALYLQGRETVGSTLSLAELEAALLFIEGSNLHFNRIDMPAFLLLKPEDL